MPAIVTGQPSQRTRRELAEGRSIAQQVAQVKVTAASNAAIAAEATIAIEGEIPTRLAERLGRIEDRLSEIP